MLLSRRTQQSIMPVCTITTACTLVYHRSVSRIECNADVLNRPMLLFNKLTNRQWTYAKRENISCVINWKLTITNYSKYVLGTSYFRVSYAFYIASYWSISPLSTLSVTNNRFLLFPLAHRISFVLFTLAGFLTALCSPMEVSSLDRSFIDCSAFVKLNINLQTQISFQGHMSTLASSFMPEGYWMH